MKQELQTAKEPILKAYGREPETMDELAECVIAVINSQCQNNLVGLEWEVRYDKHVSNSHSAPVGYPENFGNKPGVPRSYPGWTGRIWVRYRNNNVTTKIWASNPLKATLTHTGTGGSGSYNGPWTPISRAHYTRRSNNQLPKSSYPKPNCLSWDYKIFAFDWPNIAKALEQEKLLCILANKDFEQTSFFRHRFHWMDPTVAKADREFIKECNDLQREVAV